MKASDLMIGDWIHCILENKNVQVETIGTDDRKEMLGNPYIISDKGKYDYLSDFEPIPLTEEILLNNGFFESKDFCDNKILKHNALGIYALYKTKEMTGFWVEDHHLITRDYFIEIDMYYVHQLQHFFNLMGVEIEIKL